LTPRASALGRVASIAESCCETARPVNPYAVGDILAHLWELRLLFANRQNAALIELVDGLLDKKPESLSSEQWEEMRRAIFLRRTQLE
jgi:hypothetical protein